MRKPTPVTTSSMMSESWSSDEGEVDMEAADARSRSREVSTYGSGMRPENCAADIQRHARTRQRRRSERDGGDQRLGKRAAERVH